MPYLGDIFRQPLQRPPCCRRRSRYPRRCPDRAARVLRCKPRPKSSSRAGDGEQQPGDSRHRAPAEARRGRHIHHFPGRHHAVLHCSNTRQEKGFEVTLFAGGPAKGGIRRGFKDALRRTPILVSIMAANNEIGTVQPVAELAKFARPRPVLFHTGRRSNGRQRARSRMSTSSTQTLVSICGPQTAWAERRCVLFTKSPLAPDPILFGGAHENERRAGTENLAAIIGLVEALERFVHTPVFEKARLARWPTALIRAIERLEGVQFVGRGRSAW